MASIDTSRNYTPPATAGPSSREKAPVEPSPPGLQPAPQNIGAAVPGQFLGDIPAHLAFDLGPIPNATGTVVTDQAGTPVAYIVAADDNTVAVSHRFAISQYLLAALNSVRRADDQLYIGDTLNLNAQTITTVGDENGTSYNFTERLPNPHPPQN